MVFDSNQGSIESIWFTSRFWEKIWTSRDQVRTQPFRLQLFSVFNPKSRLRNQQKQKTSFHKIRSPQKILKSKNTIQFKTASLWGAQYEAKSLKEKSDLVIIDTPPKIDADGRPAIEVADLVLIPISPSQVDFWATESIIELAKREKKEILILINRANAKSKLIKEAVKFVNDMKVKKAKTILGNRQIFVSSMGLGLTVVEKQRTGKGCLEMLSLAKEIQSFLKI